MQNEKNNDDFEVIYKEDQASISESNIVLSAEEILQKKIKEQEETIDALNSK